MYRKVNISEKKIWPRIILSEKYIFHFTLLDFRSDILILEVRSKSTWIIPRDNKIIPEVKVQESKYIQSDVLR